MVSTEHARLSANWQEQQRLLHTAGEPDALRFIRYYLMAYHPRKDGRAIRKKDVYDVFSGEKPEEPFAALKEPTSLSRQLRDAAEIYSRLKKGRDDKGEPNAYLYFINTFAQKFSQHLVPLMAVVRLANREWFVRVAAELEALSSIYTITGTPTNNLERSFALFAQEVGSLSPVSQPAFDALVDKYLISPKRDQSNSFDATFMKIGLRAKGTKQKLTNDQVKTLLGRIAFFIETTYHQDFDNYKPERFISKANVHIDHILCQKPKGITFSDRDRLERNRLGNLTLLSGVMNTSAGNLPYTDKARDYYTNGGFVMTTSMVQPVAFGAKPANKHLTSLLNQYPSFGLKDVEKRQAMLLKIARLMWSLD